MTSRLSNTSETTAVPLPSSYRDSIGVAVSQTAAPPVEPTTSVRSTSRITVTLAPPSRGGGGVGAAGESCRFRAFCGGLNTIFTDLGRLVKTTWNDLKELLGFVPNCMNGGTRTGGTTCRCPKLFEVIV